MRYAITIPVYLSRENNKWVEGDTVYDHPTPINEKGTLVRTLESLKSIEHEDFDVVLIISTTTPDIDEKVQKWINNCLKEAKYLPKNIYIFSKKDLILIKNKTGIENQSLFLSEGYSPVRNMCLVAGLIQKCDAVVLLDDDELVLDDGFIKKINHGLNTKVKKEKIRLITGACPEGETGSYIRTREYSPWMVYWDKIKFQNQAFKIAFGSKPRFKVSPFTHGGLAIIHKEVFSQIPFDPNIQRGEDMDYNMNCRMFGYKFYSDSDLEIRHCPPPRVHPLWKRVREDMVRFIFQKNKILNQKKVGGVKKIIKASEFYPYPGPFLEDSLDDMIFKSQTSLSIEYLIKGDISASREALNNIIISKNSTSISRDFFLEYIKFKNEWVKLAKEISKHHFELEKVF